MVYDGHPLKIFKGLILMLELNRTKYILLFIIFLCSFLAARYWPAVDAYKSLLAVPGLAVSIDVDAPKDVEATREEILEDHSTLMNFKRDLV